MTNSEAMKIATLIDWITGTRAFNGKVANAAEAKDAALYLADRACKTGCCIIARGAWDKWPTQPHQEPTEAADHA